ncbi:MAG: hypothetical protein GY773_10840 [Actinomycetia bacterium]|nr:hypothetical protein [Actinomycetes bacterium]
MSLSPAAKPDLFLPDVWRALEDDAFVIGEYDRLFERCREEVGPHAAPLDPHLRFLRRLNLSGLLERLDRATMLAGVEGRTPFADSRVLAFTDALPMALKLDLDREPPVGKLVLRRAFSADLPPAVLSRPKASFPLPFQGWLAGKGQSMSRSCLTRGLFLPSMVERIAADPAGNWPYAWPMANLARWGDRWWG